MVFAVPLVTVAFIATARAAPAGLRALLLGWYAAGFPDTDAVPSS
ncbi:MAG: hypothetical protein ACRDUV_05525 [Pseudonocardiaceae bacterium]